MSGMMTTTDLDAPREAQRRDDGAVRPAAELRPQLPWSIAEYEALGLDPAEAPEARRERTYRNYEVEA